MDYFSLCPFYEKNSINHKCHVQKLEFKTQRLNMTGLEYNLEWVSKDKELFYISKSRRDRTRLTLLNYYYIFKGTIFQSPDLYTLMLSSVESLTHNFNNVLNLINDDIKN